MSDDDMPEDDGYGKAARTPFMQFYTSDWTAGTVNFTLEQRGFYFECLKMMWETKSGLVDEPRWLASAMRCDVRTARRLRDFLVEKRKLKPMDNLLINSRMEAEIGKHRAKIGQKSGRSSGEVREIFSKNPIESKVVKFIRSDQNPDQIDRSIDRGFDRKKNKAALPSRYVSEEALDVVRKLAPGWDRQMLLRKFMDWPGSRDAHDMDAAFKGWVKSFTKGKSA